MLDELRGTHKLGNWIFPGVPDVMEPNNVVELTSLLPSPTLLFILNREQEAACTGLSRILSSLYREALATPTSNCPFPALRAEAPILTPSALVLACSLASLTYLSSARWDTA